jgi:hypothetical protein
MAERLQKTVASQNCVIVDELFYGVAACLRRDVRATSARRCGFRGRAIFGARSRRLDVGNYHRADWKVLTKYHCPSRRIRLAFGWYQERRAVRRPATEPETRPRCLPSREGIRPVGAKTTLVLSQTFEGIFS